MIRYDWEFVYTKCFHCLFGETETESEGRGVRCLPCGSSQGCQWWEDTEEVLVIPPQMAYNFRIRLEEYLENLTRENRALLWQIRLMRMCPWHQPRLPHATPDLTRQPSHSVDRWSCSCSSKENTCQYICYLFSRRNPAAAAIFERILWHVSFPISLRCYDCTHTFLLG